MSYCGDPWTDIPEFGEKTAGGDYQARPGAYAVLFNAPQCIAVLRTPPGCYLPGGGSKPGETPEETLQREVREECGYTITEPRQLGEAIEFVFAQQEQQYFSKHGVFFVARLGTHLSTSQRVIICCSGSRHAPLSRNSPTRVMPGLSVALR